jgi:ribosomal protein S18 acetylase RimI-like enzyme
MLGDGGFMAARGGIEVFDFCERDLGLLSGLTYDYFSELRAFDETLEFTQGWEVHYRGVLKRLLNSPTFFLRGARLNGKVAGFIMFELREEPLWRVRRRGYLSNIYVVPAFRRKGVGAFMVDGAMQTLRQMDAEVLALDVYSGNDAARAFWASFGFAPFKERLRVSLAPRI